jgi:hypothetical protein
MSQLPDAASIIAEGEALSGISDPEPQLHVNLEALVTSLNKAGRCDPSGAAARGQGPA